MDKKLDKRIKSPDFWTSEYLEAIESGWVNTRRLEGLFWQASIKYDKFESLIAVYPDSAERGIRFNRIFKQPVWENFRPVCEIHLGPFVKDCDMIASLSQQAEERIAKHKGLLERISAETLVIHFAYWLEKKYFEFSDDSEFVEALIDYRNVLQECLKRITNSTHRSQSEILATITKCLDRIKSSSALERETTQLFEAVFQWMMADFSEEMFCSQGWAVSCANSAVTAVPATVEHFEEMHLPRLKSHVSDILEFELPFSPDESDYQVKLTNEAPNPESAHLMWSVYTGMRFLTRSFSDAVLLDAKGHLGIELVNLLQTLLAPVTGYRMSYFVPRSNAKREGKDYLSSIIPGELFNCEEVLDLLAHRKGGTLSRHPIESRELSSFVQVTRDFFKGSIPDEESTVAFDAITVDIHDKSALDMVKGKHFMLLKNQNCYLFLPRLFFSHSYVLQIVFDMLFEKNVREVSNHFECRVEELFERVKFHVARNYTFINDGKTEGEVDVFAFRDNTLFIIEAKMVQPRLLVHNIRSIPNTFQKAGDQLDVALDNLPHHWPAISRELNISLPYESIRIATLIVSNSCEYDHQYFNGHLKISWHELEAILASLQPFSIYLLRQRVLSTPPQDIPEPSPAKLEQYRLFPDGGPSVEQMLECLEHSRYWKLVLDEPMQPTPVFTVKPSCLS